jgi:hypothetical protein
VEFGVRDLGFGIWNSDLMFRGSGSEFEFRFLGSEIWLSAVPAAGFRVSCFVLGVSVGGWLPPADGPAETSEGFDPVREKHWLALRHFSTCARVRGREGSTMVKHDLAAKRARRVEKWFKDFHLKTRPESGLELLICAIRCGLG